MKAIIRIGKPIHFKIGERLTACGIAFAKYAAYDPRDVDCIRCLQTRQYKEATK